MNYEFLPYHHSKLFTVDEEVKQIRMLQILAP